MPDEELGRAVASALDDARAEHERLIAGFALATIALAFLTILWRTLTIESRWGIAALAVVTVYGGVYLVAWIRHDGSAPSIRQRWVRTTLEVTGPLLVLLLDTRVSPAFAINSGANYVFPLAIALSALRLEPRLCLYAGVLALLEQTAVYVALYSSLPDAMEFKVVFVAFRYLSCLLIGAVGYVVSRTLAEKTSEVARDSVRSERVRSAFGSYVDERVVQRVLDGEIGLAPERRALTVMFVDIRDFTRFSEERDPQVVFHALDATLDAFSLEVQRQGGIVNKFLGDGLMAIFGAPEIQPDHARRAVRAALAIRNCAAKLATSSFPDLRIGIALHTGEVIVGDLGGVRREYTAIGDVVNVASRVESANKELGTTLLITEAVRSALGNDAEVDAKPALTLRGRSAPVQVYEVLHLALTGERHAVSPRL